GIVDEPVEAPAAQRPLRQIGRPIDGFAVGDVEQQRREVRAEFPLERLALLGLAHAAEHAPAAAAEFGRAAVADAGRNTGDDDCLHAAASYQALPAAASR